MKKIQLNRGYFVLVSDEDFKYLSQFTWHITHIGKHYYASRTTSRKLGKQKQIFMHQEIMKTPKGMETDHVDGNGLNNCRENLRIATKSQNQFNRGEPKNNKSGFKDIKYYPKRKKYKVEFKIQGKSKFFGYFPNLKDAIRVRNNAIKEYHKEFSFI